MTTSTFSARIQRKEDFLPRFVVVPPDELPGRVKSFPAEVWLNGYGPFARNIHPWGKGRPEFFFNLTADHCRKAGLETGDECVIRLLPKP